MKKNKKTKRQLPLIGGQPGPRSLPRIDSIQMGDELAGGEVVAILWYKPSSALIVCEQEKYWDIHHYRSDTLTKREFKGKEFYDNLYTFKTLSNKDFELKEILSKLISLIKL